MAKALKHNVTIKVHTLGNHEFTATDTDTVKLGTHAFTQFQHHDTVEIVEDDKTTYIPFHAIEYVEVTKATNEVEYEDDNCVMEGEAPTPDPEP